MGQALAARQDKFPNLSAGNPKRGPNTIGTQHSTKAKFTKDITAACLQAFEEGGGAEWLKRQMKTEPRAFMALLGKILPSQIHAKVDVVTKQVMIDFTGLPPLAHDTARTLVLDQVAEVIEQDEAELDAILMGDASG